MMRRYCYITAILGVFLPAIAFAGAAPSVYVCAHPDDCLLFMSPNIYNDTVGNTARVVTVYLTSGDAGLEFSKDDSSAPYPYARERASIEATQWMVDTDVKPILGKQETETVTVNGHPIDRVSYGNTASYFLRLPDGNMYGDGFERYGHESLKKLKAGEIDALTPIDGQAPYTGWRDVVDVLAGILARETQGEPHVTLHIADPDVTHNHDDHSDHTTGASAVIEALAIAPASCYQIYQHIDYSIAQKPQNLAGEALQNKAGSFAVLTATQRRFLDHHNWDKAHVSYLTRNYYRTRYHPSGCNRTN